MVNMLWLIFALISLLSSGTNGILHRYVLKEYDYISYGFIWSIFASLFYLPLFVYNFSVPATSYPWFIAVVGMFLWTLITVVGFKAFQGVEASLLRPISQVKLLFVLFFSYIFLSELMTFNKILGTFIIFSGMLLLTWKGGRLFGRLSDKGVQLIILTSLLLAMVAIVDKSAMAYWNPGVYGLFMYLIPGLVVGIFTIKRKDKFMRMMKRMYLPLIITSLFSVLHYYFELKTYALIDVSTAYPILKFSSLVTVIGGILLLK